ncbi:MAG: hypothetical protein O3A63_16355, partial [Proteobacteria bacterium]|nr:hypothetical protein [Pseudomonadota bacterium]
MANDLIVEIRNFFSGRSIVFWLVMLFVVLPIFPALFGSIGFLLYIYWPIDLTKAQLPEVYSTTRHVILISHGLNDTAEHWPTDLKSALSPPDEHTQIIAFDWNPYARNTARCSVDGKRIGQLVGEHLAHQTAVQSVHFVGHSCGAFINLGACRAIKATRPEISVQTTYLDAVAIYGGIIWDYGLQNFGTCADFADAYIDTGDGVPG